MSSFLALRMRAAWLLLGIVMLTTFIAAALLGALATFSSQVMPEAVHARLAASPGRAMTVIGLVTPRMATTDTKAIRHGVRGALLGVSYRMDTATWSPPLILTTRGGGADRRAEVASMSRIRSHADLVSGSWPAEARAGRPAPAAVPELVAHQLQVRPGSVVAVRDPDSGTRLELRVTGLYRQRDPGSGYWDLDAIWTCNASSEGCFTQRGPIVVAPSAFATTSLPATQASWVVLPDTARIGTGDLATMAGRIHRAAKHLQRPALGGLVVTTSLPEVLRATAQHLSAARTLLAAVGLELIVPTLAVLALGAGLLASHREHEVALLGARGTERRQLVGTALAEALLADTASVVLGTLAALGLTGLITRSALPAKAQLAPPAMTGSLWITEAATLAVCVLVMVAPALRRRPEAVRPGRQTATAAAVAGADLILIALAALAVWQLRGYSAGAYGGFGGIGGVDPLLAITPALALAAASLVPVRGLPVLARAADRVTDASRRLGPALTGWTLSRGAARQSGPVLLAVFVVATGTLALAEHQSWRTSAQDRAAFATGSDVRVEPSAPLSLRHVDALTQAPGVVGAMAVSNATTGTGGELLALDAEEAPATVLLRPDLSPQPTRTLWQRIVRSGHRPGIVLPGHPARLRVLASLTPSAAGRLRPAAATFSVQDSSGAVYTVPAGRLVADGRRHGLTAVLSPSRRAEYPLRLLGLSLSYPLPPFSRSAPARSLAHPARFVIGGLAIAKSTTGAFEAEFEPGVALQSWRPALAAPELDVPLPTPATGAAAGTKPRLRTWTSIHHGSMLLALTPGHRPSSAAERTYNPFTHRIEQLSPAISGHLTITAPAPAAVVRGIATNAFLHQSRTGIGARIPVTIGDTSIPVKVVGRVSHFPTVTGHDGALIVDQATVQAVLASHAEPPLPVTSWWLRTRSGRLTPSMRSMLPPGAAVTTRTGQATALLGDPLSAVPQRAVLAVAAAMALLAAVGFAVAVAASVRARRSQSALLAALGVGRVAQARVLCAEQLVLALPAALIGLVAGFGLAYLLVPVTILTGRAGTPVPAVLVEVPIGRAVLLALVVAVIPLLAAAATVVRRSGRASGMREAEPS